MFWSDLEAIKSVQTADYLQTLSNGVSGYPLSDPDPSIYRNQAEYFKRLSWFYSAIERVAEMLASLVDWRVFELSGKERVEIDNHESEQLFFHPNEYQFDSRFEFFEALAGYLKLNGNAYVWMNALNPETPPAELWILRPDRMFIVPDPKEYIRGYVYEVNGRQIAFERDEIIHFKTFHPTNDWYGLSALESLSVAADLDYKQQMYARNFYDKDNAKAPGALGFADYIEDSAWKKMKADVARDHGGVKRKLMMLRGVGKGGVQWVQMGLSQHDMQYLQSRQFSKEEIYQALAPGLLQILDKNATEANAIAGEKTLREYGIWPMMQRIAEKFTARMMPRYGPNLVGEFDDIRHRDRSIEQKEQQVFGETHTVGEIRKKYYEDHPIGDERDNMLPAEIRAGASLRLFAPPPEPAPAEAAPTAAAGEPNNEQPTQEEEGPTTEGAEEAQLEKERKALMNAPELRSVARRSAVARLNAEGVASPTDAQIRAKIDWLVAHINDPEAKSQTGVMVALTVPAYVGAQLLHAIGDSGDLPFGSIPEPLGDLHVTLAYLGDPSDQQVDPETVETVLKVFASRHAPVRGVIGGIGKMPTIEGKDNVALYALFDSPELPAFRQELVEMLAAAGIEVDPAHGFVPHVTLAYVPSHGTQVPAEMPNVPVLFRDVTLAWGGEWRAISLTSTPAVETVRAARDADVPLLERGNQVRMGAELTEGTAKAILDAQERRDKEIERNQWRKWAAKRMRDRRPLEGFVFKSLTADEQAELRDQTETLLNPPAVSVPAVKSIQPVRNVFGSVPDVPYSHLRRAFETALSRFNQAMEAKADPAPIPPSLPFNVFIQPSPVAPPSVTIQNQVQPTPVTVEAHNEIQVPAPTVNVPAPQIDVHVQPTPVTVEAHNAVNVLPPPASEPAAPAPVPVAERARVIRDEQGRIVGLEKKIEY